MYGIYFPFVWKAKGIQVISILRHYVASEPRRRGL